MEIGEVPLVDVRGPLTAQRGRLLSLLVSLDDAQWAAPTAAPQWLVKDIALHLLDVDLGWLAQARDHDQSGIISVPADHEELVRGLAQRNQRWVDGTRVLSPRLIISLLAWSGEQLDAYLGTVELARASSVYWAGPAPLWFDLAREFTERWVHYGRASATSPGAPWCRRCPSDAMAGRCAGVGTAPSWRACLRRSWPAPAFRRVSLARRRRSLAGTASQAIALESGSTGVLRYSGAVDWQRRGRAPPGPREGLSLPPLVAGTGCRTA